MAPESEDKKGMVIEVAYALSERQKIIKLVVKPGITARQAVINSGIKQFFSEIDTDNMVIGIFGKKCKPDDVLHENDRVEIYRPLLADPREIRKKRAAQGKRMKKGGGDIGVDAHKKAG